MNEAKTCENHDARSRKKFDLYQIGKWGAIGIIAYYLFAEHRAHVIAFLPYLLLLACPLMHIFMHGGHSEHHQHKEEKEQR